MRLKKLLESIEIVESFNEADNLDIQGIAYHSGKVSDGALFVCIKGYKDDGHKYLSDALQKGAKIAIVEELNKDIPIPQYRVNNSRVALARLSATFYGYPANKLKVIGVTATNGKTTTAYMINHILHGHNLQTGLIGTVQVKIGDKYSPADLTTPESLDLQNIFKQMVDANTTHTIMEVSSAALEMSRVETVDFDIVTLNNINREHIDMHGTFENYVATKTNLIRNANKDSIAVLNLDCEFTEKLLQETSAKKITFSVNKEKGDFYVKNLDLSTGRAKFTIHIDKPIEVNGRIIQKGSFDIQLAIPGLHSVSNSMVAIIVSIINGVPISTITEKLATFSGVERRFEFIYEKGPIIIDDHFANPGNIDVTLETLDFMKYNKLHLIYGIRGQRGVVVNKENAESITKWAENLNIKEVIATKSVSHVTERDKVTEEELEVFLEVMDKANIKVLLFDELPAALQHGIERAAKDDLVLIAGTQGMDSAAPIALEIVKYSEINK